MNNFQYLPAFNVDFLLQYMSFVYLIKLIFAEQCLHVLVLVSSRLKSEVGNSVVLDVPYSDKILQNLVTFY